MSQGLVKQEFPKFLFAVFVEEIKNYFLNKV